MKSKLKISLLFAFLLPFFVNAQCAMCRAVLESSGNSGQAEAINNGIVYLVIWPYLCIAGIGFAIWWSLRKNNKKTETEP